MAFGMKQENELKPSHLCHLNIQMRTKSVDVASGQKVGEESSVDKNAKEMSLRSKISKVLKKPLGRSFKYGAQETSSCSTTKRSRSQQTDCGAFSDCFVSMSTMSQRSHLIDSEAWRVVGRLEGGQTHAEVAQAIGVSQSVISRIWNRFLETGSAGRRPG
ncbi:hypothetical protein TNCV_3433441 [Trichonephila clavipes]|nr:hypothetical protein TNCV_3433441 [Trichonephila clavipes]